MSKKTTQVRIRLARLSDVPRLAALSGELGYPASDKEIRGRLAKLKAASRHAVFVAEAADGVIGWLHVSRDHLLEVSVRAEINGLVVSGTARSVGVGKLLVRAAEDWARKQKCTAMSVRSNVIRDRAHAFYEREGYEHYKTQKAFRKPLK